jgi:ubiquinone/menaquinone biosynthesis C-methylase UbiE
MTAAAHAHIGSHIFQWPRLYDLMLRLVWRTHERSYRRKVVDLAGIQKGDFVLDVGSGTGTLAISAARRAAARVTGIDPSAQMVARARVKAQRAGVAADFREAMSDDLPFSDDSFDAVLSTTVLHCIAPDWLERSLQEMVRVLKPGGRLLLVDFGGRFEARKGFVSRMRPHREFDICKIVPRLDETELEGLRTGDLGFSDLYFIAATKRRMAA